MRVHERSRKNHSFESELLNKSVYVVHKIGQNDMFKNQNDLALELTGLKFSTRHMAHFNDIFKVLLHPF